jgi:hypothetical protein
MSQYQGRARTDIWKIGCLVKTRSGALGSRSRLENRRDGSPRTMRAPHRAAPRTLNKYLKQTKFYIPRPTGLAPRLQPLQEQGPLMIGRILTQPDGARWPRTAAAFAGVDREGPFVRGTPRAAGFARRTPAARATWPTRRSFPTARWWPPAAATSLVRRDLYGRHREGDPRAASTCGVPRAGPPWIPALLRSNSAIVETENSRPWCIGSPTFPRFAVRPSRDGYAEPIGPGVATILVRANRAQPATSRVDRRVSCVAERVRPLEMLARHVWPSGLFAAIQTHGELGYSPAVSELDTGKAASVVPFAVLDDRSFTSQRFGEASCTIESLPDGGHFIRLLDRCVPAATTSWSGEHRR